MRFLSVAQRELRAASRQRGTFRARWITAAAFLVFLIWLIWLFDGFRRSGVAAQVFSAYAYAIHFYCLIIGTALTADCISEEKREGTLGLLFLTNLSSFEIIAGKVCSRALGVLYGVVAIFPMLALPFLMGGITFEHFWRTLLALLNTLFFSVAAGFLGSVLTSRQFTAIATALALALSFGGLLLAAADVASGYKGTLWLVPILSVPCPLYTLAAAEGIPVFGNNHYWISLATVMAVSVLWLTNVVLRLRNAWRDRPKAARTGRRFRLWDRWQEARRAGRAKLRRRLLSINPFFWLGGRQRVVAPVFMLIIIVLVIVTETVTAPYFGRVIRAGTFSPIIGHAFAWLWSGLALHAMLLYYAAMISSRRLAEDKQSGALELILSTPTDERAIGRGLWLAFGRRMFFPVLAAALIHVYFIWQGATLVIADPPTPLPAGITPGKLIWALLFDQTLLGTRLGWEFHFLLNILLLFFVLMICAWITLAWVGRWLGLRLKHPGFAPMISLALLIVPPILLFSFEIYLVGKFRFFRLPERHFLPLMLWSVFAISAGNCALLSCWAAGRLRHNFRSTVTSRFQPPERRCWLPRPRTILRLTIGTVGTATAVAILVLLFYGYQNWRSRRAWSAFQVELKQKGKSLQLAAMKVTLVPDAQNFARSAPFRALLESKKSDTARTLEKLQPYDIGSGNYGRLNQGVNWTEQDFLALDDFARFVESKKNKAAGTNLSDYAVVWLRGMQPMEEALRALTSAIQLPHFQIATNTTVRTVLNSDRAPILALERLHFLLEIRACAHLLLGHTNEASEDLLTTLRLAQLAREIHDAESSTRVQILAARSLQPLWEGLARHQWNETQLTDFQTNLAAFNLLADHTNAIHRIVLAHMEAWRAIAETNSVQKSLPIARGGYIEREDWEFQPRGWWLDLCIQLDRAGENAIAKVNFAAERMSLEVDWQTLNGLRLGSQSEEVLQQSPWAGANPVLVAFAQTAVNQAIIACALERFRIAHGKFPEGLDELVPGYLVRIPPDWVRGRPVIYQRMDDGRYILRGVGLNDQDDRKLPTSDDWLWWYGTNAPPAVKVIKEN